MLAIVIAINLPFVQTKIAKHITNELNKDYKVDINIEKVAITAFGTVKLKDLLIKDHHKDTLIHTKQLNTNFLDFYNFKWKKGDLIFGDIRLNDLYFNLKTYKGEKDTNFDRFLDAFDDGKPTSGKFLMTADAIYIENSKFLLTDENRKVPKDLDLTNLDARLTNFIIKGPNVDFDIEKFKFKDHRGIDVKDLQSKFSYTKKNIILKDLKAKTKYSELEGNIKMSYDRKDLGDFNNKVFWDFNLENSKIGSDDVFCFYKEIGKGKTFLVTTKMKGSLNNFVLKNFDFKDGNDSKIKGDLKLINSFGKDHQRFKLDADFENLETSHTHLVSFLPNLLKDKLPSELKKLNNFTLKGKTILTADDLIAKIKLNSALGFVETDLDIKNVYNTANATYKGKIITDNFNVGNLINDKEIGKVTMNIDVDGKGFTKDKINTQFKGKVSKIKYNEYNYSNIEVNGLAKKPFFSGKIIANDPNLKMNFDGKIDFSSREKVYQFETDIQQADLKKLNFINDSISNFKGKIVSNLKGNNLDNIQGSLNVIDAKFQKNDKIFNFKDISVSSIFDNTRERTLKIDAKNILEGEIIGKYSFSQIVKVVQNALGSIYTNYKEHNVSKNAYMKFNFLVNNQFFELFYPEVVLDKPSRIRGTINAQNNDFKLFCNANKIDFNNNKFYNLKLELDNKNPAYNAFVSLDSIQNKRYTVSDFNLLNITEKDTMYMRSEFKGGKKKNDIYNLDFYHTIDVDNQNIIGFNKSDIIIKNYNWFINEEKDSKNKIIIDNTLNDFYFDNLTFSHENEKATFKGSLKGKKNKDLQLDLLNLNINKLIPFDLAVELDGNLSGNVNLYETATLYEPKADLLLSNFKLNKDLFGDLKFDLKSNQDLDILKLNLSLKNENIETIFGNGTVDIKSNIPQIDLDLNVNKFDVKFLNKFSKNIISNVRGLASGSISVKKDLQKPEINGRLYLNNAGLKVDYTEVDYDFENESIVDITQNLFNFRNIEIVDKKHQTNGVLNGYMKHQVFENWYFDLDIQSDYFNIFDKKDDDISPFFGTAFIKGTSSLTGPMNALILKVDAYSEKGTSVKIPITESTNSGESSLISYLTREEKFNLIKTNNEYKDEFYGLEMDFDINIDKDAEIEVILNKETGHSMKGRGNGNLLIDINTLGKFNMFGDVVIEEGIYNFSYQNLFNRIFKIKQGGNISWDGNPFKANLDLQAIHDEIDANPSVLLENSSVDGRKVQVAVGIDLIGQLDSLNPEFTISFPTLNPILASELNTKLQDKDTRTTQALMLLASSSFTNAQSNFAQDFLTNNFYETIGTVLGKMLNDENGNIYISPDIVIGDNNPDSQNLSLYGLKGGIKINDKITVNGKAGILTGENVTNTLIGNVELLYRLNEDGTLNFRAFNKENDINYIGEGIGYTQGLGFTHQFDFNNLTDIKTSIKNIFNGKKKKSDADNDVDNIHKSNKDATDPKDKNKKDEKPAIEQPPLD